MALLRSPLVSGGSRAKGTASAQTQIRRRIASGAARELGSVALQRVSVIIIIIMNRRK